MGSVGSMIAVNALHSTAMFESTACSSKENVAKAGSGELHDLAGEHSFRFALMRQVQDDILGCARRRQCSGQTDANGSRNTSGNFVVFPDACDLRVADAVCKTVQRACRTCVRIGAEDDLSRQRDFLTNDRVTNSRAAARRVA